MRTSRFPRNRNTNEEIIYVNDRDYVDSYVSLIGPVDINFDGIYEIVIYENSGDIFGAYYVTYEKYILDFTGEKPQRIGRSVLRGGC